MKSGIVGWGNVSKKLFPTLKQPLTCKWLIVGGGIAGLSSAYFLLEAGETDVVIIEKNTIGSGSTGHSAGMLICEPEHAPWAHYVQKYGKKLAGDYYDAQHDALSNIRKIISDGAISCGYETGDLFLIGNTKGEATSILRDFSARKSMAAPSTLVSEASMGGKHKLKGYLVGQKIRGEVSVNPLLFARGFAHYLARRGVQIFEHTEGTKFSPTEVVTKNGVITFEKSILCLGTHTKDSDIKRYLTTICLTKKLSARVTKQMGLIGNNMFIDDEGHSFHYGKMTADNRLLLGYGDLKQTGKKKEGYTHMPHVKSMTKFLEKTFPSLPIEVEYAWSAEYAISNHDVPLVHVHPRFGSIDGAGTQIASFVAAEFLVSRLLKKKHPLTKLFS